MGQIMVGESAGERVASALREQIISGELASGTKLTEESIAADLGVSRLPVRDALRALEREALIETQHHKGARVRRFSDSDQADLGEVIEAMDLVLVKLAAERRTEEHLTALRAISEVSAAAEQAGDEVAVVAAATEYRELLVDMAGNQVLAQVAAKIRSRMTRLRRVERAASASAAELTYLTQAIAAQDAHAAQVLVRDKAQQLQTLRRERAIAAFDQEESVREAAQRATAAHTDSERA